MKSLRALWLALSCLTLSCSSGTTVDYHVERSDQDPSHLAVRIVVHGAPRDSLVLRGYAADEILAISGLTAAGPEERPLAVRAGVETVAAEGEGPANLPRIVIRGPLPVSLSVRYRVRPGKREGDPHTGFTGRCYGYSGGGFALVTGRDLFLVPQPAEGLRRIRVWFALPSGWKAVTPWEPEGDHWRTGVDGTFAAEQLISASLGLGSFRERSLMAGGTELRFAFESSIPEGVERRAAEGLGRAARYVHGHFGRDLGRRYVTLIAPETPEGDEIAGEAWGTGQGQTLAPLTGNRLHDFAAGLIGAYLRYEPYRTEVKSPAEFWLVDGITGWYSWRAVAAAGFVTEEELSRGLAEGYLTSFNAEGVEQNLESLYATAKDTRISRDVLAPFVLLHLDRQLRDSHAAAGGLDPILPGLVRGRIAPSLWSSLPGDPGRWRSFRERIVRGNAMALVEPYFALTPTRPAPEPPAGPATRTLTLAYTGNSAGYLENCGCKVNQSGGMARRATLLSRLRRADPDLVLLDAGSAFARPEKENRPDFFSQREQALYLELMDSMRYGAAAVGTTELSFGVPYFRSMTRGSATPWLAANLLQDGRPVAPGWTTIRAHGIGLAVVGLFEPPRGKGADPLFEDHASEIAVEDPVLTLQRELPPLRGRADLLVVMGRLSPTTIRRIAAACPEVSVIVSTDDEAPARRRAAGRVELHNEDQPGFIGRTLVLYTALRNYGLGSAELGVDREGRIASAVIRDHWLRRDVPDDPAVRRRLDRFYAEVGRMDAAQAAVPALFQGDPSRRHGRYVGAARCAGCHEAEYAQWKTTKHAFAYKTLLDVHRHYQPRCVSCHVVGYGTASGYRIGAPEEPLGNVQCEVCHGPGAAHAEAPSRTNTLRRVPESVCLECHNPDHSDRFVYEEQLPKVVHEPEHAAPAALAAGSR